MSNIKKLLSGATAGVLLAAQVTATTFAATNSEVTKAVQSVAEYIYSQQKADGSIAAPTTDQTVVAVAAMGGDPSAKNAEGNSAISYLQANPLDDSAKPGDIERRILAIAAAGEDPEDFGGVDYVAQLISHANNDQLGDINYINDDIFGILAAATTENEELRAVAQDSLHYIITSQGSGGFGSTGINANCDLSNGGVWCGGDNSNDTASALIALVVAAGIGLEHDDLEESIAQALEYLLTMQNETNGGFLFDEYSMDPDGSSTSWSLMALNIFSEYDETIAEQANKARDWLIARQNDDGSFIDTTVSDWGTYVDSYTSDAVLALLGTTWLLFPEPIEFTYVAPSATLEEVTVTEPKLAPAATQNPAPQTFTTTTATTPVEEPVIEDEEVLGEQNDAEPAAPDMESTSSNSGMKYVFYAIVALAFITIGWRLAQPEKSKNS